MKKILGIVGSPRLNGNTHILVSKILKGAKKEGATGDMISKGAKCTFKVTKLLEAKSIEMDYVGDLVGTGTWTFEPIDGKTKVQYHSNVKTNKLLFSIVSPFVNFGKGHSENVEKGFKSLNSYLSNK